MLRCLEVPDCVSISGRITTAHVAALRAHPELQPRVPHRDTAVATRAARLHVADATDVRTRHCRFWQHHHAWRVRTTWPSVESNDDMRFMLQIDSARQRRSPRQTRQTPSLSKTRQGAAPDSPFGFLTIWIMPTMMCQKESTLTIGALLAAGAAAWGAIRTTQELVRNKVPPPVEVIDD